jgi:ectoine hydroxylase-related dioxygenase (phytanoyl-CoA dioxygenase family)
MQFRINNHDLADPVRPVAEVLAPEQKAHLIENGYVVRERLLQGEALEAVRQAVDELAEEAGGAAASGSPGGATFGGLFVRRVVEKHPIFWRLAQDERFAGLARAILGPQVQLHAGVIRVTYPGQPGQETHWHFHQRVIPEPLPPFFARPRVLDNLIYLDDLDEETGPFCVLPGSHLDLHKELPAGIVTDRPGQVKVMVPAGSCVTADAALWHRGMPTTERGRRRRLLILGYSATWMKQVDPIDPEFLPDETDRLNLELLGRTGYY